MKRIYISLFAASALLSACNYTLIEDGANGQLSLELSASDSYMVTTKASSNEDKNEFKVDIVRPSDGFTKSFSRFGDMPSTLELPSGAYKISVSSPNTLPAAFDQPIYGADHEFVVKVGEVTTETIECTLRNMKVSFNLTDAFKRELSTYTISVSNGSSAANTLYWENVASSSDQYTTTDMEKAGYFTVEDALTVRVDGKRSVDDSEAYHEITIVDGKARDHFIITLDAKVTGSAGFGIDISTDVNEREEDVYIPGFDEDPIPGGSDESGDSAGDNTGSGDLGDDSGDDTGDDSGSGDDTGDDSGDDSGSGDDGGVTYQDMTMVWPDHESKDNVYPVVDINNNLGPVNLTINVPGRIAGFEILIESESEGFMDAISGMTSEDADPKTKLDLINDPVAIAAMGPDGVGLDMDLQGKTSVLFDLTNLIPMISFVAEQGTSHFFTLTVTDEDGYQETWELTFYLP